MATDETKTPGDASANDASANDASANDAHVPAPPPAPQGHGHGHDHDHDHDGPEAPPPGVRLMGGLRWGLVIGMAVVAFLSFWFLLAPPKHDGKKYTCPMVEHAFVVADEAGECPLCHMKLVPMEASVVEARKAGSAPSSEVPGVAPIALHLDRAQHAGVRTELVTSRELSPLVRAAAQVAVPEQGESHVHVRAPGFVERVAVREVGASVGAGQPLAYVYSPDVYRAEEELLLAKRLAGSTGGGGPTVDAMRKRLVLLGMTERDVDDVLAKDTPARLIAVRAPAAGIVTRKDTALGAYVTPETVLYTVVDLSAAYVVAELPARDLPLAPRGTVGRLRLANAMAEVPVAVDLVYPEISPAARTARVRLRVVKQAGQKPVVLRPGQAGEVVFDAGRRRALVVPRDALVDTGLSRYVFVDEGEGKLSPRAVVIGREESEALEIVSGLREGERVVVGATFLIDSESRMHAALAGVAAPAASSSAPAAPASPSAPPGSPPTSPPAQPAPHGHAHGAHP